MRDAIDYSPRERFWLWALAAFGFIALNGVFLWALVVRPDALAAAIANPVAGAFMLEAFLLVGVFAYLLRKCDASRLHWSWFLLLSLIGGLAFSLPIALLWRRPAATGREART